ncbi:MAG: aminotransferase class I/II-fold pyridoxal phosphate-dependent enzyme [Pseudomonadota bacterium]
MGASVTPAVSAQGDEALLASLRAGRGPTPSQKPSVAGSSAEESVSPCFDELQELQTIRLQQQVLRRFGLTSPFFRRVDGQPGPTTVVEGRAATRFTSYDYLGLNEHPAMRAAAVNAIHRHGVSPGASRLVGGEREEQRALEERLAHLYDAEDAIVMVSGHATNVTVLGTLLGSNDLILIDALGHNSTFEGARLSGAARRTFPHNDLDRLDALLSAERHRHRRALIAVEGLYSMDGDCPDLNRLVEIKERHDAWLMVDEAHALGVLGATGRGLHEAAGIDPSAVDIWMGTLSKTLAATGGYIAGSRALIDLLRHTAPGFVFSVGLAPVLAAAATTALDAMLEEPERVARLAVNGAHLQRAAVAAGLDTGTSLGLAVVPVILGNSLKAVALSAQLAEAGIEVAPIVHPAVPERSARLRFFVTSEHEPAQIDRAIALTAERASGLDEWYANALAKLNTGDP